MKSEEMDRIHQRIAERLNEKQFAVHSAARDEDSKLFRRGTSLTDAWAMVVCAFAEAREIVREEIERK